MMSSLKDKAHDKMWLAEGADSKKIYMLSNTRSMLMLRLQRKFKTSSDVKLYATYPEAILIKRNY